MFKNKTIKLFLILGVIIFSLTLLVGCSNQDDNNSLDAIYIETIFEDNEEEPQFYIINNHKALDILLSYNVPEIYNEVFFKTKSLLIFKIVEPSQGNQSEIESYTISEKTINVYVKTKRYGVDCAEGHWFFVLELTKNEVDNFESVKIFKNGEVIINDKVLKLYSLPDKISDNIKHAYANKIYSEIQKIVPIEDVNILYYLGQYGNSYACIIEGDCMQIPERRIQIGPLCFEYVNEVISIYNDNNYYNLKEAYELNIINNEQLENIYKIYQEYKYSLIIV